MGVYLADGRKVVRIRVTVGEDSHSLRLDCTDGKQHTVSYQTIYRKSPAWDREQVKQDVGEIFGVVAPPA